MICASTTRGLTHPRPPRTYTHTHRDKRQAKKDQTSRDQQASMAGLSIGPTEKTSELLSAAKELAMEMGNTQVGAC